jgi:hypothetical protein
LRGALRWARFGGHDQSLGGGPAVAIPLKVIEPGIESVGRVKWESTIQST